MAKRQGLTTEQSLKQMNVQVQIQVGKMLEMTGPEFEEYVRNELDENLALEKLKESEETQLDKTEDGEPFKETSDQLQAGDYNDDDDIPTYRLRTNNSSADDETYTPMAVSEQSLTDYLREQINELNLSELQREIAKNIIGNLDDDGYLVRTTADIADDITFYSGLGIEVEEQQVEDMLRIVQTLDPPGIAATSLQECILIQLKQFEPSRDVQNAITIVEKYFEQLSKQQFERIAQMMGLSLDEIEAARKKIKKVNPKPGNGYSTPSERHSQQIIPDFEITIDGQKINLTLQNSIPELVISKSYEVAINDAKAGGTRQAEAKLLRDDYNRARDFISFVKKRQSTLFAIMNAIVKRQRDYLLSGGDEAELHPMVLRDIAVDTGFDTSVISRATSNKYVTTPWGVFSLKHFFSEGTLTESGEEVSNRELQKILKELIEAEDKNHPLSDEKLCQLLKERGFVIARRTVAKYRDSLGILKAGMRKNSSQTIGDSKE